jgi:hypothetical protein
LFDQQYFTEPVDHTGAVLFDTAGGGDEIGK